MRAYFVHYPEDTNAPEVKVRYLTSEEKDHLIELMAERMGGDAYSDCMGEFAGEATKGEADFIVIEST